MKPKFKISHLFWLIYMALLGVLLPHTAWAFAAYQEPGWQQNAMAWALAIAFELSILAFTHQLKSRIEHAAGLRFKDGESKSALAWRRFTSAWVNIFGFGLLLASGVSALANFSYAVEFGRAFVTFTRYGIPRLAYELAFGGILPVVSLLFARILADTPDPKSAEVDVHKAERALKSELARLRAELEKQKSSSIRFRTIQQGTTRERIIAIKSLWPDLPQTGISVIAEVSPSRVSEILRNGK